MNVDQLETEVSRQADLRLEEVISRVVSFASQKDLLDLQDVMDLTKILYVRTKIRTQKLRRRIDNELPYEYPNKERSLLETEYLNNLDILPSLRAKYYEAKEKFETKKRLNGVML